MNRAARKSSRKRMEGRVKRKSKQMPARYSSLKPPFGPNRAQKKLTLFWARQAKSQDARDEARKKRQKNQLKARRVLAAIRKATRKAMRRAANL